MVTVEDVPELKLMHPNWSRFVARKSSVVLQNSEKVDVPLSKLIGQTLRVRPDIVSVEEVRNREEVRELINSVASGHGGITSLHSEDFDSLKARFNYAGLDDSFFSLVSLVIFLDSYVRKRELIRRVTEVGEVVFSEKAVYRKLVSLNPKTNTFEEDVYISERLRRTAERSGTDRGGLEEELKVKGQFLSRVAGVDEESYYNYLSTYYRSVQRGVNHGGRPE